MLGTSFLLLLITAQKETILFFLYSSSVYSKTRCHHVLIIPHRLRNFAYFMYHEKKERLIRRGNYFFVFWPTIFLECLYEEQFTVEVFTLVLKILVRASCLEKNTSAYFITEEMVCRFSITDIYKST